MSSFLPFPGGSSSISATRTRKAMRALLYMSHALRRGKEVPLRVNPFGPSQASPGMTRNVGTVERVLRAIFALVLLACVAIAPVSIGVRLAAFGLPGVTCFA